MLYSNLSTRPFYNERAVQCVLWGLGGLALAAIVVGSLRLSSLSAEHASLEAEITDFGTQTTTVQGQAEAFRVELARRNIAALTDASDEANQLIDQRVFSWTEFFNRIEATLPDDIMLTSLRPEANRRTVRIGIGLVGRTQDAINAFVERLEMTSAFSDVLVREEEFMEDGTYRAVVSGVYATSQDARSEVIGDVTERDAEPPV